MIYLLLKVNGTRVILRYKKSFVHQKVDLKGILYTYFYIYIGIDEKKNLICDS